MRVRPLLVAALVAFSGCRSKEAPAPAASATLPEAPAPASLLAELSLGDPKQTWANVRALGGPAAEALPSSLPVLLTTSLSFPPAVASSLDEKLPMVGALLSHAEATEPDVVLGMHVVSGAELVASLTLGDGAKFRRVELGPRVVRLVTAPGAQEFNGALGVSGNYLLVATRVEAMKDAGRFVAEVLPKRARTEPGLAVKAGERLLKERVAVSMRAAWKQRRAQLVERAAGERAAKGAPDFAEPEVLLAGVDSTIESFLDVVESSRELSLSLAPKDGAVRAEVWLTPSAEGASALFAREMVTGPLAPLLRLPAGADAALMLSGDEKRAGGPGLGQLLQQLFGDRLKPEQAAKLTATLESFDKTRRGATAIGLLTRPSPALLLQFELSDEAQFSQAFADLLKLSELGPVRSWLAGTWGTPTLSMAAVSASGGQARLRFQRATSAAGAGPALPKALALSWEVRGNVASIVIASDEKLGLAPAHAAEHLDGRAWLQGARPDFAAQTALALYLDAGMVAPGGPDEAPLLLALGKRGEKIVLSLELSRSALATFSGVLR